MTAAYEEDFFCFKLANDDKEDIQLIQSEDLLGHETLSIIREDQTDYFVAREFVDW